MHTPPFSKSLTAGAVFAAVVIAGMLFGSKSGQAANDNNGAQDEKQMIQIGLDTAVASGIHMNMTGRDPDMVGLGSYLVNVIGDCNGCHTADPATEYAPGGNPYFLRSAVGRPSPPFFSGRKQINAATYLGGGSDFGPFPSPNGAVHIISRNLTPCKTRIPECDHTLAEFTQILRTGIDLDHAHPNCPTNFPNCLLSPPPPQIPPFNGDLLQVMPWPNFQNLTDRQIAAIYTFISTIPCLEGGPGEPAHRCS